MRDTLKSTPLPLLALKQRAFPRILTLEGLSITQTLVLTLVGVVVLVIVLMTAFNIVQIRSEKRAEAYERLQIAARMVEGEVKNDLTISGNIAKAAALQPDLIEATQSKDHDRLLTLTTSILNENRLGVFNVVALNGDVLSRAQFPTIWGDSIFDGVGEAGVLDAFSGRAVAGIERKKLVDGALHTKTVTPIIARGEGVIGAIIASRDLDNAFCERINRLMGVGCTVYDANVRIATSHFDKSDYLVEARADPALSSRVLSGETVTESIKLGGAEYLVNTAPLYPISGGAVGMVSTYYPLEGLSQAQNAAIRQALIAASVALAVAVLLAFWVAKAISRPLLRLASGTEALIEQAGASENPSRSSRLSINPNGDPTTHRLALTINKMLERIEEDSLGRCAQILRAQEEERRRISRELHDETSQSLAALLIGLEVAERNLPETQQSTKTLLSETRAMANETIEGIHNLAVDLRPTMLDELGLIPTLRWFTKRYTHTFGISVDLTVKGVTRRLSQAMETALFRIIQEALTNAAKHAQASRISLTLQALDDRLIVKIKDNGKGFSLPKRFTSSGRLGLLSMKERCELLGGELQISSAHNQGTTIELNLPLTYLETAKI